MRLLNFTDGFESASAPTQGSIQQNSLASYATDAAFVSAKGSGATEGDAYYNTTYDLVRVYQNSAWRFITGQLPSFATAADYVTAKGSAAENGDRFYDSTNHAVKLYQNSAWHFAKSGAQASFASDAAYVTGKGSAAAEGDAYYNSTLKAFRGYLNSNWETVLSTEMGWPAMILNGVLVPSVAASALTIALKTKAGSDPSATDPVFVVFRSATATDGAYVVRKVTAATSVVIASTVTLGHVSAVLERIYVYLLDNSGTVELAVSTSNIFDENSVQSTSTPGNSRTTLYSTTARTSKAIRLIGRLESTQATAGTWATAISEVAMTPHGVPMGQVPAGTVLPLATVGVPDGYLACDGSAISRTTYAKLFAAMGTIHGTGDGSTTFNVPDYRGRFLRGRANGQATDPDRASRTAMATGGNTGDNVGSVQTNNYTSHTHTAVRVMAGATLNAALDAYSMMARSDGSGLSNSSPMTAASGGNETRPENAYVNYCVKY